MSETLTYSGTLKVVKCWCGMRHAVPIELDDFQDRQHENGVAQTAIVCPLGHNHIRAGKGAAAKLKDELVRKQAELDQARSASQEEFELRLAVERDLKKERDDSKKRKDRALGGVCPCCNRSFKNVQRHLASKHPTEAKVHGAVTKDKAALRASV